jgi:hypothetical protein
MSPTRLQIAKRDITAIFDNSPTRVLRRTEIDQVLSLHRGSWRLAQSTTGAEFIAYLTGLGKLTEHIFRFPNRREVRYVWGDASELEIIQTLRTNSYFTHFTALSLLGLTEQIPKTIYLNSEQKQKPNPNAELEQGRIDLAFRGQCRTSKTITEYGGKRICLLNGANTGRAGVIAVEQSGGATLQVTSVERTLIDATVRPAYAGGIQNVIDAFRLAQPTVSINRLSAMLSAVGYAYPYHQAVGFYLERADCYTDKQLLIFDAKEKNFDFYLTHGMKKTAYSKRWRLHYPAGL